MMKTQNLLATIAAFSLLAPHVAKANVPVRAQLMAQKSRDFSRLIKDLAESKDPATLTELMALAKDTSLPEDRRYMAVMGVSRKASNQALPWLLTLLSDASFHVRSASLTSIAAISRLSTDSERQSSKVLRSALAKTIRDPALWIRSHALGLTQEFQLRSLRADVEFVMSDSRNLVQGQPLAIVQKANQILESWN